MPWCSTACRPCEVAALLAVITRRIERLLTRRGVGDGADDCDAPDRRAEEAPVLAGLAAASVRNLAAPGTRTAATATGGGGGGGGGPRAAVDGSVR